MSTRFGLLAAGLVAALALPLAEAEARGGHRHGGGGYRGGFSLHVGPPAPYYRPRPYGYRPYGYYAPPPVYLPPPIFYPPPVYYAPPPVYALPPPAAYLGGPSGPYLPPTGGVDGGYKR